MKKRVCARVLVSDCACGSSAAVSKARRCRLILPAWLQAAETQWDGTARCQPSWPHPGDHLQPINALVSRWERQSEGTAPQVNMKRQREEAWEGKQRDIKYLRGEQEWRGNQKKEKMRDWEWISFSGIDYCTSMHLTRGSIENQRGKPKQTKHRAHLLTASHASRWLWRMKPIYSSFLSSVSPSRSWSTAAKEKPAGYCRISLLRHGNPK